MGARTLPLLAYNSRWFDTILSIIRIFFELEAESTDLSAGFVFVLAIFFGGFELSFLRLGPDS